MALIENLNDQSLPRTARIPKRREISGIQRSGKKIYCKNFVVTYKKSISQATRIAVTVSKKVDKKAVVRNKIKRRIKEVFRMVRKQLAPGLSIVVIARPTAKDCSFSEYRKQLVGAFRSHNLLKRTLA